MLMLMLMMTMLFMYSVGVAYNVHEEEDKIIIYMEAMWKVLLENKHK